MSRSAGPPVSEGWISVKYPHFNEDPTASLLTQFNNLSVHQHWDKNSTTYRSELSAFLAHEFERLAGSHSKLANWQALCELCGIEQVPTSIRQCKKTLNGVHVNLVDLVEHMRKGGEGELRKFASRNALIKYTKKYKKFFPRNVAKENGFLRALLVHMG